MVSKSQLLRTINEEESMKNYTGKGLIRINNNEEIQVEYDVNIEFDGDANAISFKGYILNPQEAIEKASRITGILILKDGQEIDFFDAQNGKITPMNFGSAMRNF